MNFPSLSPSCAGRSVYGCASCGYDVRAPVGFVTVESTESARSPPPSFSSTPSPNYFSSLPPSSSAQSSTHYLIRPCTCPPKVPPSHHPLARLISFA